MSKYDKYTGKVPQKLIDSLKKNEKFSWKKAFFRITFLFLLLGAGWFFFYQMFVHAGKAIFSS
jgi:hypothetical protein